IKEMIAGIDDDRARRLAAPIAHGLAQKARIDIGQAHSGHRKRLALERCIAGHVRLAGGGAVAGQHHAPLSGWSGISLALPRESIAILRRRHRSNRSRNESKTNTQHTTTQHVGSRPELLDLEVKRLMRTASHRTQSRSPRYPNHSLVIGVTLLSLTTYF